jgi:hypothetical protein
VLDIENGVPTSEAMHKAYRRVAKAWHPDRFAHDVAKRLEAEEHFKLIQIAYRELTDHNPNGWMPGQSAQGPATAGAASMGAYDTLWKSDYNPAKAAGQPSPQETVPQVASEKKASPSEFFAGVPGCYPIMDLPPQAANLAQRYLEVTDFAYVVIDLSGHGRFDQFMMVTTYGLLVRNREQNVALLRYDQLGEPRIGGKNRLPWWRRMMADLSEDFVWTLEIYKTDGTLFYILDEDSNDDVKRAVYRFLHDRKKAA